MGNDAMEGTPDFFAGLLQDHARIEARLKALEDAAARMRRVEGDVEALRVVTGTLDYFATEGARHEALEELTLFPRLEPRPEFKQILSALVFQHRMNDTAGRELAACAERFAPGSGRELQRLVVRFVEMHRGHAVAEERALFPLAASVLPPPLLAEMSRARQERNPSVASIDGKQG